jgi:FlaA1/EpsC-like NDP-sugar epimerase
MLLDPSVLALSYVIAAVRIWHLTEFSSFAAFFAMRIKVFNLLIFLGLLYSWHIVFSVFNLYESRRLGDRKQEVADMLKATSLASLLLGLVAIIFHIWMISPAFVLVFWLIATCTIILCRLGVREFLRRARKHGRNLHNLLIIGTNPRAVEFAHTIEDRPELGYKLIGFDGMASLSSQTWTTFPLLSASTSSMRWQSLFP